MKIACFSAQPYEISHFEHSNQTHQFQIDYIHHPLNSQTISLLQDHEAIICFVNDKIDQPMIDSLVAHQVKFIALRCAGFNNVDIAYAHQKGLSVARVPAYSPHAVAEFALGMILSLNRKYHRAYNRVREHNFSLNGLTGFDLYQKTIGIIGTGKIGEVFCQLLSGFGCSLMAYDPIENSNCIALGVQYTDLSTVLANSDIISLHCPLTPQTEHLINQDTLKQTKPGVMIINTGRGRLIETAAMIQSLKNGQVGALGIDVYEEEEALFFQDLSETIIQDDQFLHLQAFPNVIITGHQAFLTTEALQHIAQTTLHNIHQYATNAPLDNAV